MARRRYDNSGRAVRAAETTERILRTARELLLQGGYQAMTVTSLAEAAGVSPQTVYNSVGGKAQVLKAVYDVMLAGDARSLPMSARPEFRALTAESEAETLLRGYARHCRRLYERVGPLLGVLLAHGPGGDHGLEDFVATIDRERRTGNGHLLSALQEQHPLPDGMSARRAADIVWTVTAPEVADRLLRRCGWSAAAYERWLADILVSSLVQA